MMAEEMHKDRKKAFELRDKLDKSKKAKTKEKKWRNPSLSGAAKPDDSVVREIEVHVHFSEKYV